MDYDELLNRAYSLLPEKATKGGRFEMPVIETFIQGNKTIIKNFDSIAEKLRRKQEELARYFSKELAIPITLEGRGLVLHGKFSDRVLNEKFKAYVESYVLCKECKKADTKLIEMDRGVKTMVCEACGARTSVRI